MNKCPCVDCITFIMCNTRLKEMTNPEVCTLSKLVDCDKLKMFIGISKLGGNVLSYSYISYDMVDEARRAFGLPPVNKRVEPIG